MRLYMGVDPGLVSGGAAVVDATGRAVLLAGWYAGAAYIEDSGGCAERLTLQSGESAAAAVFRLKSPLAVAIEQPLTVGVGRHADTWRSVGHWEEAARSRSLTVHLVPFRTWTRAADIAGSDGVAEVRRRVREITTHLDPIFPTGTRARGGWPSQARDAAREAYLIARWCALETGGGGA